MSHWPQHPVVYEINTWVWLRELSAQAGRPITLSSVPERELARLAALGFDGLWLMGVWERSAASRAIARDDAELRRVFCDALPDYGAHDVVGSPYAVARYSVDPALGGDDALAALRQRLADRGLRLMLDFVPNHLAVDHEWLTAHPERFVQPEPNAVAHEPHNCFTRDDRVFAHGRDPSFDGWTDTAQLDYRRPDTRHAMAQALLSVAGRCDGVRCDMAMLATRDVFAGTWGGEWDPPLAEFWPAALTALKACFPDCLALAEAYWGTEWTLQQMGFDHTYDKHLYDDVVADALEAVRDHLCADPAYQGRLARFVENHDEPRAMAVLGLDRSRAAAVAALTLPGLRLVHQGQLEGRRVRAPVQLARRQDEEPVNGLDAFYRKLLAALHHPAFHQGEWQLLPMVPAGPGDEARTPFLAHAWSLGAEHRLVAANMGPGRAQCRVRLDFEGLAQGEWQLHDVLDGQTYARDGAELEGSGLFVDLPGYGSHLFEMRRPS